MPRSINGDTKRRNSLTHVRSLDDTTISYRSTPEYLRQLVNASSTPRTVRSRRNSVNESLNTTVNGNPKYKAQEDYYDEVHSLKKDLKSFQIENSHLRAKIRRLEEDNTRKRKELDDFYHSHKDRRLSLTSLPERSNSSLNLKQKIFKLEMQLKQKETMIDEIKRDPRWSRGTELEIQIRALLQELERQKFVHLSKIQNDFNATLVEEQTNAIRKLTTDNLALISENDSLKKKIHELKHPEESENVDDEPVTGRRQKDFEEKIHRLKEESRYYQEEYDQMKLDFKQMRRQRDELLDKFDDLKRKSRFTPKTLHDDDVRRFRRNHAAKVIQRQWRTHRENPRSTNNKSNDALKIVQAALRGYFHRTKSHRSSSTTRNENHRTGSTRLNENESRNSSSKFKSNHVDDDFFYS